MSLLEGEICTCICFVSHTTVAAVYAHTTCISSNPESCCPCDVHGQLYFVIKVSISQSFCNSCFQFRLHSHVFFCFFLTREEEEEEDASAVTSPDGTSYTHDQNGEAEKKEDDARSDSEDKTEEEKTVRVFFFSQFDST